MKIIDVISEVETNWIPGIDGSNPHPSLNPIWRILPDSSLLKGRNPFFIPDFPGEISVRPVIVIRISKLGKSIPQRFALRHSEDYALGFLFRAEEYGAKLREAGLPDAPAYSFDKSLIIGDFLVGTVPDSLSAIMSVRDLGSDKEAPDSIEFQFEDLKAKVARAIAGLSRDNTLKTGDLILISNTQQGIPIRINTNLSLGLDTINPGFPYLAVNVK